jgi:predicted lipid-binding transport protein (Tim44 family)
VRRSTSKFTKSVALAAALLIAAGSVADARPGGGRSMGSRGSNSYSAPPVTNTAPRQAQPLPGPGYNAPSPSPMGMPQAQRPRFGGGLLGGLAAGFLGAGLFGMLFGGGFLSGMGSFLGLLGFIAQIGLITIVAMLAMRWWRSRNQPATAGAPRDFMRQAGAQPGPQPIGMPGMSGASPFGGAAPQPAPTRPLSLADADFNRFEELLGEVQTAYGRGDRATLARLATPQIANGFSADLDDNARRGVVNKVTSPKLLQGDLSEAWSEPVGDYATVAMRFSIVDVTLDKASGRVVDGDPARAAEAVELWTFTRPPGAGSQSWVLSAIQQA